MAYVRLTNIFLIILALLAAGFLINGCSNPNLFVYQNEVNGAVYDVNAKGTPKICTVDFVNLTKVASFSAFRSIQGHRFVDQFENGDYGMKHYLYPKPENLNALTIEVYSPVDGIVFDVKDEGRGNSIKIRPKDYPAFMIWIFHVNTLSNIKIDSYVKAGDFLGYANTLNAANFDIAVWVNTGQGEKYLSYFDVMADNVFQNYIARGIASRETFIIPKVWREENPNDSSRDIINLN